jgi:CheY-like chemotaxis protein
MKSFNSTMLIEDDTVVAMLSKRLLEKFLITNGIYIVPNGEEALKFIVNYDPDFNTCPELIFLDIDMPVMDGFSFLESFEELIFLNKDRVQIVMLTNSSRPEDVQRCKEFGVRFFLNKPLTEEKILGLMEDINKVSV